MKVTTIQSQRILYSPGHNDECQTPDYAVRPLLKYIAPGVRVWCPFDRHDSAFVRLLSEKREVFMSKNDPYHDHKKYHKGHLISDRGVSALCFKRPRAINLRTALWTQQDAAVTCSKCLSILKEQNQHEVPNR